ncbi:hypothetical protein EV182_001220 [Spiromyces aspiralis]|uniref:Uncharacterized protein n=1 Tax=Spiromyces aspiralis TaxID=68401 RepID=A0ACC1HJG2_9FUNG|nr:hypothetical protein EV182_001220 [Spiromyces aspiralis]
MSGSRGGRGSFNWEEVKDDKHRINYIGRDIQWYTKTKATASDEQKAANRREELRRIKEEEELVMAEALGMKVHRVSETRVTSSDIKEFISKQEGRASGDGDEGAAGKGLGYKHTFDGPKKHLMPEFEETGVRAGKHERHSTGTAAPAAAQTPGRGSQALYLKDDHARWDGLRRRRSRSRSRRESSLDLVRPGLGGIILGEGAEAGVPTAAREGAVIVHGRDKGEVWSARHAGSAAYERGTGIFELPPLFSP